MTVIELNASSFVNWYAAGSPFPHEFRYDDGVATGVLITPGSPIILVGSLWDQHALVQQVHWFTYLSGSYPYSPQVMVTILGLTENKVPDPTNVLFVQGNIENKVGWNSFNLPATLVAPNGFFMGISGYSNYSVIAYDDGVGEPWEWQPLTQWSNGMGSYQPLENVTAPPLHANIFIRASGMICGEKNQRLIAGTPAIIHQDAENPVIHILQAIEPMHTGNPSSTLNDWPAGKAFQHYNVYRKNILDPDWLKINEQPVTDTSFIDNGYVNLPLGSYRYAVEAEYSNGVTSALALSNIIEKIFAPVVHGDANCDGNVNVLDVIIIANYVLGLNPTPFCFDNADVNGDGMINVLDVIATANIILGGDYFEVGD